MWTQNGTLKSKENDSYNFDRTIRTVQFFDDSYHLLIYYNEQEKLAYEKARRQI